RCRRGRLLGTNWFARRGGRRDLLPKRRQKQFEGNLRTAFPLLAKFCTVTVLCTPTAAEAAVIFLLALLRKQFSELLPLPTVLISRPRGWGLYCPAFRPCPGFGSICVSSPRCASRHFCAPRLYILNRPMKFT